MQQTSIYTRANGYLKRILVDIGDRVQAGDLLAEIDTPDIDAELAPTNTTAGAELYRIDRTDALRVFVNVPQAYATSVKIGEDAFLAVRNYVGREFTGKVTRSAGAIDPSTRTLRFQIDVTNADGALYAGMYGEVRLPISVDHPMLVVPTSALVFSADGTSVWVLDGDRAHKRKVVVGRDFGTEIEVSDGLAAADLVIKNPGERLVEGAPVRVSSESSSKTAGAGNRTGTR